jgi:hypothetical protein
MAYTDHSPTNQTGQESGHNPGGPQAVLKANADLFRLREAHLGRQALQKASEPPPEGPSALTGPQEPQVPILWPQRPQPQPPAPAVATGTGRRLDGETVKTYPTITAAVLRAEKAPAYRVYLLLQGLDPNGRGWLELTHVRHELTSTHGRVACLSKRRLRELLAEGSGLFWRLTEEKVYLAGAAKVAAALNVRRLGGLPVALPVEHLTLPIGQVKAHLFSSWLAGRRSEAPIGQETIRELTGIAPRTQRVYLDLADVQAQRNIAVSSTSPTSPQGQELLYRHGRGTFYFRDHLGRRGSKGRVTLAYPLSNSYRAPLQQAPKGRQCKINRTLHARDKGTRANVETLYERVYYPDIQAARQAAHQAMATVEEVYYPDGGPLIPNTARPPKLQGAAVWGRFETC